ncbi:hypothetical protein BH23ACT12_BH23ACT12_17400 [soil metagenome]
MNKRKVSVTVSPGRLRRAQELLQGVSVSELVDRGLEALVERELERHWLEGNARADTASRDLPNEVAVDLSALPWEED